MTPLRLAGIGATFVVWVIVGLGAGVWAAHANGNSLLVLAGLFGGLAVGGFVAFRQFARAAGFTK